MTQEISTVQEEPVQEEKEEVLPAEEVQPEAKPEPRKDQEHNWSQVRQVLEAQKAQIEELKTRLSEREKPQEEEKDEFDDLDPDDYLTTAKAKQLAERLAEKKAKQAAREVVEQYSRQMAVERDEEKSRSKFQDYDYVVDNFALPLIKNDPALAHKVMMSKNPAETAYKLGKLSDEYEEYSQKQQVNPKAEKILKNASRPVSGNAVSVPLKAQADQFSKMSKEDVWAMSQKYARG